MTSRYIERYRLPGSRYTKTSPVILAAGALLEDTQNPRLVVQLKFRSISPRMLTGLTVTVCCFDANDHEIERKEFIYENLRVRRGQSFGGYTAIALPVSGACRFTAVVTSAAFSDGGRWECKEAGAVAPAKEAAASPAAEATVAEAKEPHLDASVSAAEEANVSPFEEALPSESPEVTRPKARRGPRIRGKWLGLAAACVVVAIAAIIILPKILNGAPDILDPFGGPTAHGNSTGGALTSPTQAGNTAPPLSLDTSSADADTPHVATNTDYETFTYVYEQDDDGNCYITFEMMKELFPELSHLAYEGTPRMGDDIDAYLLDSFHVAQLVGTRGEWGSDDQYGTYSAIKDPQSTRCLLLFSDLYTLCGYSVAVPKDEGEGRWSLTVTRCDYDFRELVAQVSADFYSAAQPEFVPYNDIPASGAAYFLYAYNMRSETGQANNAQLFHLWSQYTSEYRHRHARDIATLDRRVPREGRIMLYYLLDAEYNLIGYSRLINNSGDGIDIDGGNILAPQNVRFEIAGSGTLQLVWDAPLWATEDTWVTAEAKRTTDSGWTRAGYVQAKSETRRAVSSLLLHWSEPQQGDAYQFRVAFCRRDGDGNFIDYTEYVQCPGTLTFNVTQTPFAATAQFGDTLTTYGDYRAKREYFFIYTHGSNRRGSTGFATGSSGNSSFSSYDHPAERLPDDLTGESLYAWELTNPAISGDNASITISAMPEPVTIVSSAP